VQDQDATAEMLAHLTQTLQNYGQHSAAILRHALNGLGKVGSSDAHLGLVAHFLGSAWEQSVRLAAVSALGSLGGEAAIDMLIGLLNDADIVIRWEAQEALDKLLTAPEDQPEPPLKKAETPPSAPQPEGDFRTDTTSEDMPF
jgi:HEAT repeat protein